MKKIFNSPETVVKDMCRGIELAHSDSLKWDQKYNCISRKEINTGKVILISGGGSGHEPAHAGFVGTGMLDVAVCGDVFASPSTMQIYNAIVKNKSEKGTLLIIKNYTGDCLNFEGAAELAIDDEDMDVEFVHVADDAAVENSSFTVGRRGVAGTVLVHKIAGAMAEKGADLKDVKLVAEKVIENVRSIGFAFTSCTVPAKGEPTFVLNEDEMEFGVGIHGEPGIVREKIVSAKELAKKMIDIILPDLPYEKGSKVALMINGLGGTPLLELYILNAEVRELLEERGIIVERTMVGNYMTSIDMAGASVTLLKLDSELKELLDAPAETPALTKS